mmetsp:Transcript_7733/g.20095  ORF Transcript_7733/g.20095 Transcript_7733/m.20095 type:complete len:254 (+) Transcript_7733:1055-1816(+)
MGSTTASFPPFPAAPAAAVPSFLLAFIDASNAFALSLSWSSLGSLFEMLNCAFCVSFSIAVSWVLSASCSALRFFCRPSTCLVFLISSFSIFTLLSLSRLYRLFSSSSLFSNSPLTSDILYEIASISSLTLCLSSFSFSIFSFISCTERTPLVRAFSSSAPADSASACARSLACLAAISLAFLSSSAWRRPCRWEISDWYRVGADAANFFAFTATASCIALKLMKLTSFSAMSIQITLPAVLIASASFPADLF